MHIAPWRRAGTITAMKPACPRLAACVLAFSSAAASDPAAAQHFYQGKTLTIVVGYTVGGGYDINARLVARNIGRHIPGNPNVVVSNMPGAGSLRALEHI